jgi:hypothetical protein
MADTTGNYQLVDELRDDEGLVATITARDVGGYRRLTFSLQREFERPKGGPTERSSFLRAEHVPAARRLLDRVEERMRVEQDRVHTERRVSRGRR